MRGLSEHFTAPRLVWILTVLQGVLADLPRSSNRRTDAELCLMRLCDERLDESVQALSARLDRVEQQLSAGVPMMQVQSVSALQKTESEHLEKSLDTSYTQVETPAGERAAAQVSETPAEVKAETPSASVQQQTTAVSAAAGTTDDGSFWRALAPALRDKVPRNAWSFLGNSSMVQGHLEPGVLTLWVDDELVIDAYDSVFANGEQPSIDCVIRFGRYPVSKACFASICARSASAEADRGNAADGLRSEGADGRPVQIVVDAVETRDFNVATDLFVRCAPMAFVRALCGDDEGCSGEAQAAYAEEWIARNRAACARIGRIADAGDDAEAAYVAKALELAPEGSLVFAANSMSVRLIDAVYRSSGKRLSLLCNRGLNGIDGTVSSALGAAQAYRQTTFVTGDLTALHDLNALSMQRELTVHHGGDAASSIVIVLLDNSGGGIFETLPQKSEDAYFERVFLTPQRVDFEQAARAFGVPFERVETVRGFEEAYRAALGVPGISMIEIPFAIEGTAERFGRYR